MKKNLEKLKLVSRDLRNGKQYPRSPHATCSAPTRLPFPSGRFRFTFAFFVDQAARETLSATLTPRTAAGGADGERWTG